MEIAYCKDLQIHKQIFIPHFQSTGHTPQCVEHRLNIVMFKTISTYLSLLLTTLSLLYPGSSYVDHHLSVWKLEEKFF